MSKSRGTDREKCSPGLCTPGLAAARSLAVKAGNRPTPATRVAQPGEGAEPGHLLPDGPRDSPSEGACSADHPPGTQMPATQGRGCSRPGGRVPPTGTVALGNPDDVGTAQSRPWAARVRYTGMKAFRGGTELAARPETSVSSQMRVTSGPAGEAGLPIRLTTAFPSSVNRRDSTWGPGRVSHFLKPGTWMEPGPLCR